MLHLNFQPFPVLTTARLLLRPLSLADEETVFFLRSDPGVNRFLKRPLAQTLEEARDYIRLIEGLVRRNESVLWVINLREQAAMLGSISLWNIEPEAERAEIGYVLHPDYWGQGIMLEALSAAIDYGFGTMGLKSLLAYCNPENGASIRVLEKSGFVREGDSKEGESDFQRYVLRPEAR